MKQQEGDLELNIVQRGCTVNRGGTFWMQLVIMDVSNLDDNFIGLAFENPLIVLLYWTESM
jgi:hypothetical protein